MKKKVAVERLITAQSYLQRHCIEVAKNIDVKSFEQFDKEARVSQANYFEILKKRSIHLEGALSSILESYKKALGDIGRSRNPAPGLFGSSTSHETHSNTLLRELKKALKSASMI